MLLFVAPTTLSRSILFYGSRRILGSSRTMASFPLAQSSNSNSSVISPGAMTHHSPRSRIRMHVCPGSHRIRSLQTDSHSGPFVEGEVVEKNNKGNWVMDGQGRIDISTWFSSSSDGLKRFLGSGRTQGIIDLLCKKYNLREEDLIKHSDDQLFVMPYIALLAWSIRMSEEPTSSLFVWDGQGRIDISIWFSSSSDGLKRFLGSDRTQGTIDWLYKNKNLREEEVIKHSDDQVFVNLHIALLAAHSISDDDLKFEILTFFVEDRPDHAEKKALSDSVRKAYSILEDEGGLTDDLTLDQMHKWFTLLSQGGKALSKEKIG